MNRLNKKQPLSCPEDIKRFFVTPEQSGQICLLATFLGETGNIFFPKLDFHKDQIYFKDIALDFLKENGFEPVLVQSEDEAKDFDFDKIKKKEPQNQIIFICGMPRSGSTLVEQMIAAHNDVSGAGELSYVRDTVAKNFLEELRFNKQKIIEEASAERNIIAEQYIELLKHHKFETNIVTSSLCSCLSKKRW